MASPNSPVQYHNTVLSKSYLVLLIIAAISSTHLMKTLVSRLKDRHNARLVLNIIEPVFVLVLMIAITAYLVDGSFNPFLYFRF